MHTQGRSDRIVRWEPTGAEKAVEVQEAWIKNWMWWNAARARHLQCPPLPRSPPQTDTHVYTSTPGLQTPGLAHTLPVAHYLNLPLQLPLTLSSCPPPSDSLLPHRLSTTAPQPLSSPPPVLSPRLILARSPQVGSLLMSRQETWWVILPVIPAPDLSLHLKERGIFLRHHSSSAVTAPGAFWGFSLALDWEEKGGGCSWLGRACAVTTPSVRFDPPPGGPRADSRQTSYLLPKTPLREMSGSIVGSTSPAPEACLYTPPSLSWTTSIQTLNKWHMNHIPCAYTVAASL